MELSAHFIDFLPGPVDRLAPTVRDAAVAAEQAGATMFTRYCAGTATPLAATLPTFA